MQKIKQTKLRMHHSVVYFIYFFFQLTVKKGRDFRLFDTTENRYYGS